MPKKKKKKENIFKDDDEHSDKETWKKKLLDFFLNKKKKPQPRRSEIPKEWREKNISQYGEDLGELYYNLYQREKDSPFIVNREDDLTIRQKN